MCLSYDKGVSVGFLKFLDDKCPIRTVVAPHTGPFVYIQMPLEGCAVGEAISDRLLFPL